MTDAERKAVPLASLFDYFPDALIECAQIMAAGGRQHETGGGWDKSKSSDHRNTMLRHFLQAGTVDSDGRLHSGKVAVRALMALQIEIETTRQGSARQGQRRKKTGK
jgi:hypothetical protein